MCTVATVLTDIYKTFTIHYFWHNLNFMSFIMKSKLQNARDKRVRLNCIEIFCLDN